MKSWLTKILTTYLGFCLILGSYSVDAQNARLNNGSFEDVPRQGKFQSQSIKGWFDCGAVHFPNTTPPDIHQGNTNFWENELGSAHGKTYLTLVVREDDTYETLSQKLLGTLKEGQCYTFSISLARSTSYLSHTKDNQIKKQNFIQPAVLRIWGGNDYCDNEELLGESDPVENTNWKDYNFKLEPSSDYTYITLEAYFKTPTFAGYNGNVCIDHARDFIVIDCEQEEVVAIAEVKKEVTKKVMPSFKRKKKVDTTVYVRPEKYVKTDTIVYTKPQKKSEKKRLMADLDMDKIEVGQTIKINNLYFEIDSSSINVESFEALNELYDFLTEHPNVRIDIEGHTNGVHGIDHEYCDELSTKRAKAVANYLINKGIPQDRLTYKGYGKRKPIASNRTEAGRKKNQRVQIKIISLG